LTLDDFMAQTYGDALAGRFRESELGGVRVYRTRDGNGDATVFLQTGTHRLQIVSGAVADPDKHAERILQLREILESFSIE
jgi:hypothetical protein